MKPVAPVILAAVSALSCCAALAAPRAFVASTGDDANGVSGCSPSAPCRSFQAAHDVVDSGGEVVALDTAGYGRLLISKSVTIMAAPGAVASITTSINQSAVGIFTDGLAVVLRDLNIVNAGGVGDGVLTIRGGSLSIERCTIAGGFAAGVYLGGPVSARIIDTIVRSAAKGIVVTQGANAEIIRSHVSGRGPTGEGVAVVQSSDGSISRASVSDSTASGFLRGFAARSEGPYNSPVRLSCIRCTASSNSENGFHAVATAGMASMMVASSMATENGAYGFFQQSSSSGVATFGSLGNNSLHGNGVAATSGTITVSSGY